MKTLPAAPNVQIKRATRKDIDAIAFVLHESFAEFEPLYTPRAFAATTPTATQIRERWSEGPVWIAIQKEIVVGTVGAVPKHWSWYVRSMAVYPAARGQGIAWQLLKEVETFAIGSRPNRLFLSTTPFLEEAIRLYERFGFQRSDEGPHDLFGTPLFTMVKGLELMNADSRSQNPLMQKTEIERND